MYLERFTLPIDSEEIMLNKRAAINGGKFGYIDNPYPCGIFMEKELFEVGFKEITIFYGGNGSGKSTLLNLISEKLQLNRIAPYNSGEMFDMYVENCEYSLGYDEEGFRHRIPDGSRVITSDDIFDYMLTVRTNNDDITENKELAKEMWSELRFGKTVKIQNDEDFELLRMQALSRRKSVSRRQFIRRTAGNELKLNSNGETAIRYFEQKLKNDTLYCLDEPENSMSPRMQLELVQLLRNMSKYCGCQFIIATHSPFLLALDGARVYDLDSRPARIREWWELENSRIYFDFFENHRHLFRHDPH